MIEKQKILAYLQSQVEKYSPVGVDIAGRTFGGDEKLWMYTKSLMEEIASWPDVLLDDGK